MKLTIRVRKSLSESKCIVFLSASYNVDLKVCMVIGLTGHLSEDIIIIIFQYYYNFYYYYFYYYYYLSLVES